MSKKRGLVTHLINKIESYWSHVGTTLRPFKRRCSRSKRRSTNHPEGRALDESDEWSFGKDDHDTLDIGMELEFVSDDKVYVCMCYVLE